MNVLEIEHTSVNVYHLYKIIYTDHISWYNRNNNILMY